MERDEFPFLEEVMVQLLVRSSLLIPRDCSTLLCSIWTKRLYNPDNFHAQMKFLRKTKKRFEIKLVGLNLFMIEFEDADDLESNLKGRTWLFANTLSSSNILWLPLNVQGFGWWKSLSS